MVGCWLLKEVDPAGGMYNIPAVVHIPALLNGAAPGCIKSVAKASR